MGGVRRRQMIRTELICLLQKCIEKMHALESSQIHVINLKENVEQEF